MSEPSSPELSEVPLPVVPLADDASVLQYASLANQRRPGGLIAFAVILLVVSAFPIVGAVIALFQASWMFVRGTNFMDVSVNPTGAIFMLVFGVPRLIAGICMLARSPRNWKRATDLKRIIPFFSLVFKLTGREMNAERRRGQKRREDIRKCDCHSEGGGATWGICETCTVQSIEYPL